MSLESYKMSREESYSDPIKEMRRLKELQIQSLYDLAMDREDNVLLNGNPFKKSPRIFDMQIKDSVHYRIQVETIDSNDSFEVGDYIEYDNATWLCLNAYKFHNMYCKGMFMKCNLKLYWQNQSGDIKSIWCVDLNSTQYNSGEYTDKTMTLGSAQHMLQLQCNDETVLFDSPMKFWIDKNIKNPSFYKVTQNDNTTYNYGSKGLCCITVTQCQKSDDDILIHYDDHGVTKDIWVSNYIDPNDKPVNEGVDPQEYTIIGRSDILVNNNRIYYLSPNFPDNARWNIKCDFIDKIDYSEDDNHQLTLMIKDKNMAGKSFYLQVLNELNEIIVEMMITVTKLF